MPAFEYTALDGTGRTRKGVEEGDSPRQVRSRLREREPGGWGGGGSGRAGGEGPGRVAPWSTCRRAR